MSKPVIAYIALGSNIGDRRCAIESAGCALNSGEEIAVTAMSSIIETDPVGPSGQGRYFNAVAEVRTTLGPRALLARCLAIELDCGRERLCERRWGPRPLDLDLLLYGGAIINEPDLTVPHPRMHERMFVLQPLAELAGEVVHPVLGESIECLHRRLQARSDGGCDRDIGSGAEDAVAISRIAHQSGAHGEGGAER